MDLKEETSREQDSGFSHYHQLGVNSSAPQFIQTQRDISRAQTHPGYPAPSYAGKWARWGWGWAWAPGLCPPEREAQQPGSELHTGAWQNSPEILGYMSLSQERVLT